MQLQCLNAKNYYSVERIKSIKRTYRDDYVYDFVETAEIAAGSFLPLQLASAMNGQMNNIRVSLT